MANRQWLKNYLGGVLQLDSPILEAVNENFFKTVALLTPDEMEKYFVALGISMGRRVTHTIGNEIYVGNKYMRIVNTRGWGLSIKIEPFGFQYNSIGTTKFFKGVNPMNYDEWVKEIEAFIISK